MFLPNLSLPDWSFEFNYLSGPLAGNVPSCSTFGSSSLPSSAIFNMVYKESTYDTLKATVNYFKSDPNVSKMKNQGDKTCDSSVFKADQHVP